MSLYETYVLPKLLDFCCGLQGFQNKRSQIVPLAYGKILEMGIGSGLNFDYYNFEKVEEIIGVDPAISSVAIAKSRAPKYNSKISFIESSAEALDLESLSFDCVVIGYSLCTIPNPLKALAEAHRLLKPQGSLLFMEHGLAPEPGIQKWQNRLTPAWKKIGGGCHLNRNIEGLISSSGFSFEQLSKKYIKGPKVATFQYCGKAIKT
ncbi:class I SAM-dependent methyltransferase [Gammaproteobacteria bacterium]|nr:class I SAM-dependent methyltransferase [Gammaproteobacteria bacterium]MDA8719980.1 class I SAM-dependent methyltransferase [bacterium]MDB9896524.1 class I SAM-dependent methyltransferase [Gammaproteobacteria bacterium]MDC0014543.1 class I SAM-dependent methyltransferase [Gammaproteobacteria bacterium]